MLRRLAFVAALLVLATLAGGVGVGWWYARELDQIVVEKLSGRRWDFPSKIYADPTLLYPGVDIEAVGLPSRLERLRYRAVPEAVAHPGEYHRTDHSVDLALRAFVSPSGAQPSRIVKLTLRDDIVERIDDENGQELISVEIEPEVVAGLYDTVWEERRVVTLDQLPANLINAVLAVEDQRFFRHRGIDPIGIGRAVWANLTTGHVVQGGSTLTQQLMKNFFLTEERTMSRKVREAAMALVAERRYSKREILESYLNEIYLGQNGSQGIFGVWEASQFYFHKEPQALSPAECATLAGMIKAPNRYSAAAQADRLVKRRNYVLALMLQQTLISAAEYEEAIAEPLVFAPPPTRRADAPYFVDFLRHELAATYPADVLTRDGLSIFTGLDLQLQQAAEQALQEGLATLEKRYPRLAKSDQPLQAALIAINPQTGEIKAMMGGRDYRSTQFNRVTQAFRQPGSVFKPFTYVAAFEGSPGMEAIQSTSLLEDSPFDWAYDGKVWSPENYERSYHGTVSVRDALELSLNAATARLANLVGLEHVTDAARRMGITSSLPLLPATILGAAEVSPLEVAQAYAVLANQGLRARLLAVRTVVDQSGNVVERNPMEIQRAISPQVAYLVTDLMRGVLDRGTAASARRMGFKRSAAGKTGTTNDYRDAWFAGFTPDLLAVVWVGFDEQRPVGLSGSQAALPIWTAFMKAATQGRPESDFLPPDGITLVRIDPLSGGLATPRCPQSRTEAFLSGQEPTVPCALHGSAPQPAIVPAAAPEVPR